MARNEIARQERGVLPAEEQHAVQELRYYRGCSKRDFKFVGVISIVRVRETWSWRRRNR
jgi:hypothetical protein